MPTFPTSGRVRNFGTFSPTRDVFIEITPLQGSGINVEEDRLLRASSGGRFQRNSTIQTQQDWYTYELKEIVTAHTKVKTKKYLSTEKGKWIQSSMPSQGAICN